MWINTAPLCPLYAACDAFALLDGELEMTVNVGTLDRSVRMIVGLLLTALAVSGVIGAWGYLGLVLFGTSVVGNCPAYSLLGFSTCTDAGPRR